MGSCSSILSGGNKNQTVFDAVAIRGGKNNQQTSVTNNVTVLVGAPEDREAQLEDDEAPSSARGLTVNVIKENLDRDIRDIYDIEHQPVLGSGISGQVKVCTHRITKMQYALKSLSKRAMPKERLAKIKEEIHCMAHLDHPNILRLHEYFENENVIYLILEICRGGELLERLHQQPRHLYEEKIACFYVHTMLTAIAYCHANNVVHRDLKLENFLFENDQPDSQLKLIGEFVFDNS